jgi:hypothetical protein
LGADRTDRSLLDRYGMRRHVVKTATTGMQQFATEKQTAALAQRRVHFRF